MRDEPHQNDGYFDPDTCDLAAFEALIGRTTSPQDVPHATAIQQNVPLYDMAALAPCLSDPQARRALMAEWAWVMMHGAGALGVP